MMIRSIPNYLTVARILLIPVFVILFYLPWQPWGRAIAAMIFTIACITDWLDGYLARKWQVTSPIGAFLDPVADKLLVSTTLVCILAQPTVRFLVLPVAIIIGREIVVSALREWMAEVGSRATVAVGNIGKIKTAMQMIAIILLILHNPDIRTFIGITGYILIYIAALLTLWSMIIYLKLAWPQLMRNNA
jgi:CDP-diacylglycerol--glycerol-3-phosphate 3-phosphatidyltransferase